MLAWLILVQTIVAAQVIGALLAVRGVGLGIEEAARSNCILRFLLVRLANAAQAKLRIYGNARYLNIEVQRSKH